MLYWKNVASKEKQHGKTARFPSPPRIVWWALSSIAAASLNAGRAASPRALRFSPPLCNFYGKVYGGLISTIMDATAGLTASFAGPEQRPAVTSGQRGHPLFSPGLRAGDHRQGPCHPRGQTTCLVYVDVLNVDDTICATGALSISMWITTEKDFGSSLNFFENSRKKGLQNHPDCAIIHKALGKDICAISSAG